MAIDRGQGIAISKELADSFDIQGLIDEVKIAQKAADVALANLDDAEVFAKLSVKSSESSEVSNIASEKSAELSVASAEIAVINARQATLDATSALNSAIASETSNKASGGHSADASKSALASATSAAAAANTYDAFDDRYLGSKDVAPTSDNDGDPIIAGMIYFDKTEKAMMVWDGSEWIVSSSATKSALHIYEFSIKNNYEGTENLSITGTDDNGMELSLTPGSEMVTLNGVVLASGSDYRPEIRNVTVFGGVSIGDEIKIYSFRSFELADHYSKLDSDGRFLNVDEVGVAFVAPDGDGSQLHTITVRPDYITQAHLKEDDELAIKLKGIARNANEYKHPSYHAVSMILLDLTDSEVTLQDLLDDKPSSIEHYTKQDKIPGKSLSTYDLTAILWRKLNGIESDSNNYTHPDFHAISEVSGLSEALLEKIDKVVGKGLSTNDLTDLLKDKLDGVEQSSNNYIHPSKHDLEEISGLSEFLTSIETTAESANTAVIAISAGALDGLDTLASVARAVNNDADFYATVSESLAKKVDVVVGKSLSSSDFTVAEKSKLSLLENYTHPTSLGSVHIPQGGVKDQFLKWKSDGVAEWAYDRFNALFAGKGISISADGEVSVTNEALTTTKVVSSEAEQLALSIEEGDIVVRSDEKQTYIKGPGVTGTIDDFILLQTPTDAVASVNGRTGVVEVYEFTEAERLKLAAIEATALQVAQDSYIEDELLDLGWAN